MNRKKWSRKNTTGEHPKELCYAVGWYDSPYFFFYGGRNKELTLSDVYFLNTNKWLWKKVFTVDQPLSRFYHAGCKIEGRKFYIFGGINIGKENNEDKASKVGRQRGKQFLNNKRNKTSLAKELKVVNEHHHRNATLLARCNCLFSTYFNTV